MQRHAMSPLWQRAGLGALIAVLLNITIFAIGRGADASFRVEFGNGAKPMQVGIGNVMLSSALPLAVASGVTAAVASRTARFVSTLQLAAIVITLASLAIPLGADTDTLTKVSLAAMHVVVGCAYVLAVRPFRANSSNALEREAG